jgi:archaellum component FlaC
MPGEETIQLALQSEAIILLLAAVLVMVFGLVYWIWSMGRSQQFNVQLVKTFGDNTAAINRINGSLDKLEASIQQREEQAIRHREISGIEKNEMRAMLDRNTRVMEDLTRTLTTLQTQMPGQVANAIGPKLDAHQGEINGAVRPLVAEVKSLLDRVNHFVEVLPRDLRKDYQDAKSEILERLSVIEQSITPVTGVLVTAPAPESAIEGG